MVFRHNPTILDQQATPGGDAATIEIIIADHFEFAFVVAVHVGIRNFLGLDVSMQLLLSVLETNAQISGPLGPPKKIEVIAEPLMLIEPGHGAKQAILALENDRCFLHDAARL